MKLKVKIEYIMEIQRSSYPPGFTDNEITEYEADTAIESVCDALPVDGGVSVKCEIVG